MYIYIYSVCLNRCVCVCVVYIILLVIKSDIITINSTSISKYTDYTLVKFMKRNYPLKYSKPCKKGNFIVLHFCQIITF